MTTSRFAIALPSGATVTVALFYLMTTLIASGKTVLVPPPPPIRMDLVSVRPDTPVDERLEPPPEIPPPLPEPRNPPPPRPGQDPVTVTLNIPDSGGFALEDVGIQGPGSGDLVPIVRVAPLYPGRASSRGMEGYVIVQFTVTATGTVTDAIVIESSDSLFDRAALAAVRKFKYRPRVVDGSPVAVAGVRNLFSFKLEK